MSEEKITLLLPTVAREQYPVIWQTTMAYLPTLDEEQVAVVVSMIVHTARLAADETRRDVIVHALERKHGIQ